MHEEMRARLKFNTIKIAADEGIENITTKKIAAAANIAETYIYRYFDGKSDLLMRCFIDIEKGIHEFVTSNGNKTLGSCNTLGQWLETNWYAFWNYLTNNAECSKFYTRYYNSGYDSVFFDKIKNKLENNSNALVEQLKARYNINAVDMEALNWHIKNVTIQYACKLMTNNSLDEKSVRQAYDMIMSPVIKMLNI